jgi:GNAT superfamily N-acetyltransferase
LSALEKKFLMKCFWNNCGMDIRPYVAADREACLAVFDSNMPEFFGARERGGVEKFLEASECAYFVMEMEDGIAGCGGYSVENAAARLVWGMVRRELHRKGLGRFLLLYRLHEIGQVGGVERVNLEAPSHAAAFFLSQGFKITGGVEDRVEMTMKLSVCP